MINGNRDVEKKEVQIVCFKLSGKEYGFPILKVKEIVKLGQVIILPELSSVFEGVLNLRGQLIPLVDLRKRFGHLEPDTGVPKVLILKMPKEEFLGAIVDDISEITSISESKFLSLASSIMGKESRNITAIVEMDGNRSVIILDSSRILEDSDLTSIKETIEAKTVVDSSTS